LPESRKNVEVADDIQDGKGEEGYEDDAILDGNDGK
jgi:hypothetical protein